MRVTDSEYKLFEMQGFSAKDHHLSSYAAACLDIYSPQALLNFQPAEIDRDRMELWGIGPEQFKKELRSVIEYAMYQHDEDMSVIH